MQGFRHLKAWLLLLSTLNVLAINTGSQALKQKQTGVVSPYADARAFPASSPSESEPLSSAKDSDAFQAQKDPMNTPLQHFADPSWVQYLADTPPSDMQYAAFADYASDGSSVPLSINPPQPHSATISEDMYERSFSSFPSRDLDDSDLNSLKGSHASDTVSSPQTLGRLLVKRGGYNAPYFVGKRSVDDNTLENEDKSLDDNGELEEEEEEEDVEEDKRGAPWFVGHRGAPMFVGKRRAPMFVGRRAAPMFVGKRAAPMFVGKRAVPMFVGRRAAPMFVGRRAAPMFVGRRAAPMFVGRRAAPMFVGRRAAPMFIGKRGVPMFVGKRKAPMFVGKRKAPMFVGRSIEPDSGDDQRLSVPLVVGKREEEDLSQLLAALHTLQAARQYRRLIQADKRYNSPFFIGKRNSPSNTNESEVGSAFEDDYFR